MAVNLELESKLGETADKLMGNLELTDYKTVRCKKRTLGIVFCRCFLYFHSYTDGGYYERSL